MAVKVKGLTKFFNKLTAVNRLSFELTEGQIWGFIGPNGAGKTTTLRMLATVENSSRGDAFINGHSVVHEADQVRRILGFMPDYCGAYPNMTVNEYLDFFARGYGLNGKKKRIRLDDIIGFTEIGNLIDKDVEALSKGMKQRINLCRALIHDPQILLLDEPAAGLDPNARNDLHELLRLLAKESKTVFISSHILAELEEFVDQVVIINEGSLVYAGPPEERDTEGNLFTVLDIKVTGDLNTAVKMLLESPNIRKVRSTEPDTLKVEITGGKAEIAALVEMLVKAGQTPYQITPEGKLLRKMFMQATQNSGGSNDHKN